MFRWAGQPIRGKVQYSERVRYFLLFLGICAMAQDHERAFAELTERRLRADLTFLAAEPLKGRLSLERGSDVAAHWIVSEFVKAGLQPAANGSYLQTVPLVEYRGDREKSGVTLTVKGVTKTYRAPEASASFPRNVSIKGPVVFAGFGITAPELQYDDYKGLDVRGKVVLIFDHEPQEDNATSRFSGIVPDRKLHPINGGLRQQLGEIRIVQRNFIAG